MPAFTAVELLALKRIEEGKVHVAYLNDPLVVTAGPQAGGKGWQLPLPNALGRDQFYGWLTIRQWTACGGGLKCPLAASELACSVKLQL